MLRRFLLTTVLFTVALVADWSEYKHRFVQSDGRVIDRKNGNITHSEGIGYTLYFAYKFQDDETFNRVYGWYRKHLTKNRYGLLSWKWGKRNDHTSGILDRNNATDGDMWIAYDLLLMAKRRDDAEMKEEALALIAAIKEHLIVKQKGKLFLLPAKEGFWHQDRIILNLSYYRFDILEAFSREDAVEPWKTLARDGEWLLHRAVFTPLRLHADWISLDRNLTAQPMKNRKFGYDAIRIPLNIMQSSMPTKVRLLQPYRSYVEMMRRGSLPLGTVSLDKGIIAMYDYCYGHLAIYDRLTEKPQFGSRLKQMRAKEEENYYAYALYLFTTL